REQAQVLGDRELRVQRGALRDPAGRLRVDAPAVGLERAGEDLEQRRLAGAVGPDDRDPLARLRGERDALQRLALAVALGDVRDVQDGADARAAGESSSSVPHAAHASAPRGTVAPHSGQWSGGGSTALTIGRSQRWNTRWRWK